MSAREEMRDMIDAGWEDAMFAADMVAGYRVFDGYLEVWYCVIDGDEYDYPDYDGPGIYDDGSEVQV
jgi:hypothetical protein